MNKVVDVVVVGYGGAGVAAAIAAAKDGASVLAIEKAPRGGGNTRESGGAIRGIDSDEVAAEYFMALSEGTVSRSLIEWFVRGARELPSWLESLGIELTDKGGAWHKWTYPLITHNPYPQVQPSDGRGPRMRVVPPAGLEAPWNQPQGVVMWDALSAVASGLGVEVRYNVKAVRLVTGEGHRVVGVTVADERGETLTIEATRGVVLASGGFSEDAALKRDYIGVDVPAFGVPGGNSGDGVRMAQDVGADLWHMTAVASALGYAVPDFPSAFRHHMCHSSYIYVDQRGSRFVAEIGPDTHTLPMASFLRDATLPGHPRMPAFLVFDEQTRLAGPIVQDVAAYHRDDYTWSSDNSKEIEAGWIVRGDTPEQLAQALGIDAAALAATVAEYNANCAQGDDPIYGRRPEYLTALQGPFYAIQLWPALLNTQGGPRRNERCEVLDVWGRPIAGLFSAGELGSMWTSFYPGSGNVTEALVSGVTAGRSAAAGQ